jgi:hypothetical protein
LSNNGANLGNNLVTIGFKGGGKCGKRAGSKIRITSGLRNFKNESSGANNKGTNSCPSKGNKGAKGVKSGCSGASGANKGARMGSKGANKGCIVFGKCGNKIGSRSGPSTGIMGPSNSTNGKISTGPRGPKSSISAGRICGNNNKTGSNLVGAMTCLIVVIIGVIIKAIIGTIVRVIGPRGSHTGTKANNPSIALINCNISGRGGGNIFLRKTRIISDITKVGNDKLLPSKCCTIPYRNNKRNTITKPMGPNAGNIASSGSRIGNIFNNFGNASSGSAPKFTN